MLKPVAPRRPRGGQEEGAVMAGASGAASATVAVIGAGIMGSAMTRNLVAAGLDTRVWDKSASATGPLADVGAVVAASVPDAVKDAGVVITMLPTADVVDSVILDSGVTGVFADGCVWAQMGTIGVEATLRTRDRLAAQRPDAMFHKMDQGDFATEFPLEWALKDVDLAIGAAHGDVPPLLAALSSQWHAAVAAGHGRQDISAARLALGSSRHQTG